MYIDCRSAESSPHPYTPSIPSNTFAHGLNSEVRRVRNRVKICCTKESGSGVAENSVSDTLTVSVLLEYECVCLHSLSSLSKQMAGLRSLHRKASCAKSGQKVALQSRPMNWKASMLFVCKTDRTNNSVLEGDAVDYYHA